MRKDMLKSCLESMRFFSRTTDEVMYLCDLDEKKVYFADNYARKLDISQMEGTEYSLEQIQQFMFSKSGKRAFFKPDTFKELPEKIVFQEYYLLDQQGQTIKIYSTEKLLTDRDGEPLCILGHVSDLVKEQSIDGLHRLEQEERLIEELKNSVLHDFEGFSISYQPCLETDSCRLCSAEARLCYQSPSRGEILAEQFVPLLEQVDLIAQTDRWVLRMALQQCKEWRKYVPDFRVNVNLSLIHMKERMIWEQLDQDLQALNLPGEAVTLELTESVYMKDHRSFNRIFKNLAQKEIRVAIDNFETGYSSLSYLKTISIDEIKINRRIISGIQHSAYNYRLLGNLIELAHRSKIQVCCKGVETETEFRILKELHPDLMQGYFFGKPFTAEEFFDAFINPDSAQYQEMREKEKKYCIMHDAESNLVQEYARYEKMAAVLDGMDEIVYVSDWASDDLLYLNAAGRELTNTYDYANKKCYEVIHGRATPCEFCQKKHAENDSYYAWELDSDYLKRHFLVKNKQTEWSGKKGNLTVCIDITEKEIMSKAASKDPLTGVYNRKAFEEGVRKYMQKDDGKESALILLDIDNFKSINDTYGHIEGDAALKQMVEVLRQVFRKQDLVGRLGGDEFLIFLKNLTDREIIARRLETFQKLFTQQSKYQSTCSMGITTLRKEHFSYTESLNQADIALYRSKEAGKNKFLHYDDLKH